MSRLLQTLVRLTTLFFLSICASIAAEDEAGITISAGLRDGLYFHTASIISELNNRDLKLQRDATIRPIETGGSTANLNDLLSGKSELAIVQSDILFQEKSRIDEARGTNQQIYAIASLFPEYTQILVSKNSGLEKLIQLAGRTIYIGQEGSGTESNAIAILGAAGLGEDDFVRVNPRSLANNSEALSRVCAGEIDAAFWVTSTIFPKLEQWNDCLTLLDLDTFTQTTLLSKSPFYGFSNVEIAEDDFILLSTRAVLVASKRIDSKMSPNYIFNLTKMIVEDLPAAFQRNLVNQNAALYQGSKVVTGLPIDFHPSAKSYFQTIGFLESNWWKWLITALLFWGILSAIKLHLGSRSPLEEAIYAKRSRLLCLMFEITAGHLLWLAWLLIEWFRSLGRSIKDLSFFTSPIAVALFGFAVFLWFAMLLILHFENEFSLSRDIPNQFKNIDISDFSIWLLQVISFGGSAEGIFPKSFAAKSVTVAIPIIGTLGAVLAVLMATLKEKSKRERRARGLEVPPLSDHIVMCGWNSRGVIIANEITTASPGTRPPNLVIIAESDHEKPLDVHGLNSTVVHYCRGMSSDPESLDKVNAEKASAFIVLADEKKIGQRNFRSIFTVRMIAEKMKQLRIKKPRIVVDMVFDKNLEMFIEAGADRVINTVESGNVFLAFSTFNMGFSNLVTRLMSVMTRPVVSKIDVTTHRKIVESLSGLSFSKAWRKLVDSGVHLLAIYPHEGKRSAVKGLYPDLPDPIICGEEDYFINTNDSLVIIENQSLRKDSVNSHIYMDCRAIEFVDMGHSTPIVLIDRGRNINRHLRTMLEAKCEDVFHISCAEGLSEQDELDVIPWNGEVDSIDECIRIALDRSLPRQGSSISKVKCVIPAQTDLSGRNPVNPVHLDDGTIALIIKLNTMKKIDFHYIAEIQCGRNLALFKSAGVHQPIPSNEFTSLALTKVTLFGGEVFCLLIRLMQNFFCENREDRLEAKSLRKISVIETGLATSIVGMNFHSAALALFEAGTQLIAIISSGQKVITLPHSSDEEFSYEIQLEDELFVISEFRDQQTDGECED